MKFIKLWFYFLSVLLALPGAALLSETPVIAWDRAALQAIRDTHPGPPMVARMLATMHTCMFDAWAAYDGRALATRTGGAFRRPASEDKDANKTVAIGYASYRCLVDLFPQASERGMFDATLTSFGLDPNDGSTDTTTPVGIGNVAAQEVLSFRHYDGANQLGDRTSSGVPYADYTGYVPLNTPDEIVNPDHWQPLRLPDGQGGTIVQKYLAPFWGNVTAFALTSGSQFRPTNPPESFFTEHGQYMKQVEEMIYYSANLTDEQKMIAEYWADGPASELPPGHWCLFADFVSTRDHHTLDQDVTMYFALTNAIFDASIVAWDAKRAFDSVRPVTAIHFVKSGKTIRAWGGPYMGTVLMDGSQWRPYQPKKVVTPPFPEYISGHSTFSAAGAEILQRFTGSDTLGASVSFAPGSSKFETGAVPATTVTLSWATFSEAADQAGLSRRFGGIHFAEGDLAGRALGRLVAAQAWDKAQSFINGIPYNNSSGKIDCRRQDTNKL